MEVPDNILLHFIRLNHGERSPLGRKCGLHLLKAKPHESVSVFYNYRPDSGILEYPEHSPAMPIQPRANLFCYIHYCQMSDNAMPQTRCDGQFAGQDRASDQYLILWRIWLRLTQYERQGDALLLFPSATALLV